MAELVTLPRGPDWRMPSAMAWEGDGDADASPNLIAERDANPPPPRARRALVFDSGLGGLSVLAEIRRLRPDLEIVYAADDAAFPYGRLSEAALVARVETVMARLIGEIEPDIVVIACSTASTLALPPLRAAYPHLPYDAAKDFAGVASFGNVPNILVTAPSKGFRTIEELVAKAKNGTMTFASAGVGSASHWGAERFRISAGFKATHVPFRGGPEALTEVMSGRVDFCCLGISSTLPLIKDGRLFPLVVTAAKRSVSLPDVRTSLEAGYKDSDFIFWNGLLVPAKTPRPIIDRLHAESSKALALPEVQKKLAVQGVELDPLTPTEMDAMIRREIALNIRIAKEAGLKFN